MKAGNYVPKCFKHLLDPNNIIGATCSNLPNLPIGCDECVSSNSFTSFSSHFDSSREMSHARDTAPNTSFNTRRSFYITSMHDIEFFPQNHPLPE
ncbi:hypothetical protein CEXT_55381 [Caerostris extrusa]|uniref:Uncharacterized protein n=1 Tax=Caerostris extrusa TaxID=172846 RepID=A0AAV4VR61_CAEEX|nr:hypothetical protein CEXT_55381 [Caerostris extrusa]